MENLAQQVEEIEALSAIYGEDFVVIDEVNRIYEVRVCHENDSWWSATLQVLLPAEYPARVPPVFEIHSAWMNDAEMFESSDLLHTIYRENQGEIVLYQWVEALRTFIDGKFNDREQTNVEQVNNDASLTCYDDEEKSSEEDKQDECEELSATVSSDGLEDSTTSNALKIFRSSESDSCPEILHGEPFTDRKSTFQAHLAHVVTSDQVKQVLEELKKNRKVNNAAHNVMAYRIFCEDRNSFLQDCDDDGEAAAGSRLLHLLQILNIKNIVIIVTRWYGGILLGPDRFKHYNNCARGLLKVSGLVEISPDLKDSKSKSRFKIKKH